MSSFNRFAELMQDKTFAEGLFKNATPEEAKAYLEGKGAGFTMDEIESLGRTFVTLASSNGELSEAELAKVAGGDVTQDQVNAMTNDPGFIQAIGEFFAKLFNIV